MDKVPTELSNAAQEAADRLLKDPEIREYLGRILRVAFMEGSVWRLEQEVQSLKERVEAANARS